MVAAEEALAACQDAEMPFLKGIEVLPPEESTKAIGDCEAAGNKADAALGQAGSGKALSASESCEAKMDIRQKQAEVKKFPKAWTKMQCLSFHQELQERANKELQTLLARAEAHGTGGIVVEKAGSRLYNP